MWYYTVESGFLMHWASEFAAFLAVCVGALGHDKIMHSYIVPVHAEVCTKHFRVPVTLSSSVMQGSRGGGKGGVGTLDSIGWSGSIEEKSEVIV